MPQSSLEKSLIIYKDKVLGDITNVSYDFPWSYGTFSERADFEKYRDGFIHLMTDDYDDELLLSIDPDIFDAEHWSIKTSDGQISPIEPPSIHPLESHIDWQFTSR
ncbi:hypothetical protein [Rubritalea tangerina]|uniref:Uncharacterized protein n=1 Tax=Rubritalea tangerina TaxID=430798 RepID=A0ABW4Z847_9BACT